MFIIALLIINVYVYNIYYINTSFYFRHGATSLNNQDNSVYE